MRASSRATALLKVSSKEGGRSLKPQLGKNRLRTRKRLYST